MLEQTNSKTSKTKVFKMPGELLLQYLWVISNINIYTMNFLNIHMSKANEEDNIAVDLYRNKVVNEASKKIENGRFFFFL